MKYTCTRGNLAQTRIEAKFVKESVLPVAPVLSKCFFMGMQQCADVYAIFRLELKHCLSFGVGRKLKEFIVLTFGDGNQATSSISCTN